MGKKFKIIAIVLAIQTLAGSGCSVFVPLNQPVTIIPSDPKAVISIDNKVVGTGQIEVQLPRNHSYAVTATVDGRTASKAIGTQVSVTGALDIVGGVLFLVPLIGCLTPGFWSLTPDHVQLQIPEAPVHSNGY